MTNEEHAEFAKKHLTLPHRDTWKQIVPIPDGFAALRSDGTIWRFNSTLNAWAQLEEPR